MARVQLVIPDEDRARFVQQAKKEGLSFSAWLRAAAQDRLRKAEADSRDEKGKAHHSEYLVDVAAFFKNIDVRNETENAHRREEENPATRSVEDLREFYKRIDARHEAERLGPEPDWEEHKRVINTPRKSVMDAARNSMPDVDWDSVDWNTTPDKP